MSLTELKENVLALSEKERHELLVWLNRQQVNDGDIPGEALDRLAAEVWDQDDDVFNQLLSRKNNSSPESVDGSPQST